MQRLRRGNEDLRRLVKIYAESIRQLTLDHLELEAKLTPPSASPRLLTTEMAPSRSPGL